MWRSSAAKESCRFTLGSIRMDSSSGCDSPPSARRPTACSPLEVRSRSTVSVASCVTRIASRTAAARWDRLPAAPPASGTYSSLPPDSRGSCASEATSTNGCAGPAAAGATTSRTAICASEHARPNSRSGAFSGRARRSSAAASSAPPATGGSARSPRAYPAEAPETERMTTSAEHPTTTARATSTATPSAAPSDAGASSASCGRRSSRAQSSARCAPTSYSGGCDARGSSGSTSSVGSISSTAGAPPSPNRCTRAVSSNVTTATRRLDAASASASLHAAHATLSAPDWRAARVVSSATTSARGRPSAAVQYFAASSPDSTYSTSGCTVSGLPSGVGTPLARPASSPRAPHSPPNRLRPCACAPGPTGRAGGGSSLTVPQRLHSHLDTWGQTVANGLR
mmetsp:Transcript_30610/g.97736  ORF Transcript_30610/g.97736 Transcript_30610/m.97736 type:complete len:398 (-) Transcript_30610:541-1734(-)